MIFRRIALILLALSIGVTGTILYLERDQQLLKAFSSFIARNIGALGRCKATCTISRISLIEGTIEFSHFGAVDEEGKWEWHVDSGSLSFSLVSLFTRGSLGLELHGTGCFGRTLVSDRGCPLIDHFKCFFETPPVPPFIIERLVLRSCTAELVNQDGTARVSLEGSADCIIAPMITISCTLSEGSCTYKKSELIKSLRLALHIVFDDGEPRWRATGSCTGLLTNNVQAPIVGEGGFAWSARIGDDTTPVVYDMAMHNTGEADVVVRRGIFALTYHYSVDRVHSLSASLWGWALTLWSACRETGTVACSAGDYQASGSWKADEAAVAITAKVRREAREHMVSAYADLLNRAATLMVDNGAITISIAPEGVDGWRCSGIYQGKTIIVSVLHSDNRVDGWIDCSLLRSLPVQIPLRGEGRCAFSGSFDGTQLNGAFTLEKGNLLIPGTAMIMDQLRIPFSYSPAAQTLIVSDGAARIARGSLSIKRAVIRHDAAGIISAQISYLLQHGAIIPVPDFVSVISGSGVIAWDRERGGKISGELLVDRALYDGGLQNLITLAPKTTQRSLYDNWVLSCHVASRSAIELKTPLCTLQGHLNATITGTIGNPELRGSIYDLQGSITFPYKPLYLTEGSLNVHGTHTVPDISVMAHGTIRQYDLIVRVYGPLSDPQIRFESSPSLREEQIMSLLLSGAEDGILSLNLSHDAFTLLRTLIDRAHDPGPTQSSWWSRLLRPLRRVRLIPKLSDQSGRGGVRGAVEIEVDARLRATIQHNFSLSEDIKISVDYAISDDMHVRALRDERGDYGAELEMRWKL